MHTARATIFTPIAGAANYNMKPGDEVLHIYTDTAAGTAKLPMISEAAGRWYFLTLRTTGNDLEVIDAETETTLFTMDVASDHLAIYCDGLHWYEINSTLAI